MMQNFGCQPLTCPPEQKKLRNADPVPTQPASTTTATIRLRFARRFLCSRYRPLVATTTLTWLAWRGFNMPASYSRNTRPSMSLDSAGIGGQYEDSRQWCSVLAGQRASMHIARATTTAMPRAAPTSAKALWSYAADAANLKLNGTLSVLCAPANPPLSNGRATRQLCTLQQWRGCDRIWHTKQNRMPSQSPPPPTAATTSKKTGRMDRM